MRTSLIKFLTHPLLELILIAAIYWGLASIGKWVAIDPSGASPIWPASGFAFWIMLKRGLRFWPAIWLGSLIYNIILLYDPGSTNSALSTLAVSSFIGLGAALQAVVGAYLVCTYSLHQAFVKLTEVFQFFFLQILACLSSATIGVTALLISGNLNWSDSFDTWSIWYFGDLLGVVLVSPVLMTSGQLRELLKVKSHLVEPILIILMVVITTCLMSNYQLVYPLFICLLPFIVWAAVRGGSFATASTVLVIGIAVVTLMARNPGYSTNIENGRTLILIQFFLAILSVTGLAISASLSELKFNASNLEEAVERYRSSEASMRVLIECAPEAIVVLDTASGLFVESNENARKLFKLTHAELTKKSPVDLSPELQENGVKSSLQAKHYISLALNDQSPIFEWIHQDARGQKILCEVRLVKLPSTEHDYVRASITDISQRRKLEADLQHSKTKSEENNLRLNLAMRAGNIGLWDWNMKTNQVYFSDQFKRQLGLHSDYPMNSYLDWESRLHPDDIDMALKTISVYINSEQDKYESMFRLRHENGSYIWFLAQGEAIRDLEGKATRMLGVHIDITQRKMDQQVLQDYSSELEKINEELNAFAYVASHDLKSPLRNIRQLAEWIDEDLASVMTPDTASYVQQLFSRIDRLDNLLNDLLLYSRAGRIHGDKTHVDLRELLMDVQQSVAAPEGFQINIEGDLPVIETYDTPLFQILLNLVGNAIKHHDKNSGVVNVNVQYKKDHLLFRIQDDGPGIDNNYHDRIFRVFETLKSKEETQSTGVGLAIVKKLVEHYGGTIEVSSIINRGTEFTFSWPLEMQAQSLPSQ